MHPGGAAGRSACCPPIRSPHGTRSCAPPPSPTSPPRPVHASYFFQDPYDPVNTCWGFACSNPCIHIGWRTLSANGAPASLNRREAPWVFQYDGDPAHTYAVSWACSQSPCPRIHYRWTVAKCIVIPEHIQAHFRFTDPQTAPEKMFEWFCTHPCCFGQLPKRHVKCIPTGLPET